MANKNPKPSSDEQDSTDEDVQVDKKIDEIVNLVRRISERLWVPIRERKWTQFLMYLTVAIIIFLAPGVGLLYKSVIQHILSEYDNSLSFDIYNSVFVATIFLLFLIYLLLKTAEAINNYKLRLRLVIALIVLGLIVIVPNISYSNLSYISENPEDNFSWGETSLFERNSPESVVSRNNLKALNATSNPFKQPFKVAVAVPISWRNGFYNAREILAGVSIAQQEWNSNSEHRDAQIVILIADDGYSQPDGERQAAQAVAKEITENRKDIVGVIGHFSSEATLAADEIYKQKKIVSVSPTSTAIRCSLNNSSPPINPHFQNNCLALSEYVFRTSMDDVGVIEKLLSYLIHEENLRIVIFYEKENQYSRLYKDVFTILSNRDEIPVVNVSPDNLDANNPCDAQSLADYDPTGCFKLIDEENANAILLIPSTKNNAWVEKVIEKLRQSKYSNLKILGSDSMYQESFIKINQKSRDETEGMQIPLSWHRSVDADANADSTCTSESLELECRATTVLSVNTNEDFEKFGRLGINWRTAMSYDAAQALFYGIHRTATDSCYWQSYIGRRSQCIKENLQGVMAETRIDEEGQTSQDPIKFKNGDRSLEDSIGVIVSAQDGQFRKAPNSP